VRRSVWSCILSPVFAPLNAPLLRDVTTTDATQAQAQGGYRGMSPENDPLLRLWADQRAKQTRSSVGVLQVGDARIVLVL